MKNTEPDFEVRNLSEYSVEDLQMLLELVMYAQMATKTNGRIEHAQKYDIWAYRIKDALSQAKKNEVTKDV